jgi:uncharacterized protein (TIGR02186 family)
VSGVADRRIAACLMALVAFVMLGGQRGPILVPEISQHEIQVRQGFTGTELLLFGAILDPVGTRGGGEYDIVVVLKGPTQSIRLREKSRVAGIWVNAKNSDFRSAPAFYAVASSRPIADIVDDRTAAIYELGLDWLQLSPIGMIDPDEQARFSAGLVDLRLREGLYQQNEGGVTLSEQVLYQARIALPSHVQTGTYTAETFAISRGLVIDSAVSRVEVRKLGVERFVAVFADKQPFWYGIIAVGFSLLMGWIAGRVFAFI